MRAVFSYGDYRRINVLGTEQVVQTCRKLALPGADKVIDTVFVETAAFEIGTTHHPVHCRPAVHFALVQHQRRQAGFRLSSRDQH
jgi:hypothetical protein